MNLENTITIGLKDSVPLEERKRLIRTNFQVQPSADSLEVVNWLKKPGNNIFWCTDLDYPNFCETEKNVPYFLLYKGSKPTASKEALGIVGTRRADLWGLQEAFRYAFEYAANGFNIVSGLAEGCDQAAALGAIQARKLLGEKAGLCYAIIGNGLERNYPSLTSGLKKQIIENNGSLISQFLPNYPPLKYNFPKRNLVIAAFSTCLLVSQAPQKSGSLITADFALQMGKDVYVSKYGVGEQVQRLGTNSLYEDGANIMPDPSCGYKAVICDSNTKNSVRFGSCFYVLKEI